MEVKVILFMAALFLFAPSVCVPKRKHSRRQTNEKPPCTNISENFEESKPVTATIGENITLQCITKFNLQESDNVEWSKGNDEIFTVKKKVPQVQIDEYKNRLWLSFPGELGRDVSINISHVKKTDDGIYCCCIRSSELQCINRTLVVRNKSLTTPDRHRQAGVSDNIGSTSSPQNNETTKCFSFASGGFAGGVVVGIPVGYLIAVQCRKCKNKRTRRRSGPNNPPEPILQPEPLNNPRQRRSSPQENESVV